jgi:CRISPR-associated endonuclease/helicase Cas3
MAFALRHALRNDQRRIVVAVPYLTITEQTAAVYREIFERAGDETSPVLEHHSAAEFVDDDGFDRQSVVARLAAENWDSPIVVTTTVQLFESLFSNRRGHCRKLHRLAESVVILDEAQALPSSLLRPILDALRELSAHYRTTVVLSTATQPAFETIREFADVPATEIVPDAADVFAALRRVDFKWLTSAPLAWTEVAAELAREPQVLTIVNTKRDAWALLDALGGLEPLHLSTSLCGAHRRAVLKEVRRRLAAGEACRLVSTQVVEAGVDLDFPVVWRAVAPLDGVIQGAGRCNRDGRLAAGRVAVFEPAEGSLPGGDYRLGTAETRKLAGAGSGRVDPNDPDATRA